MWLNNVTITKNDLISGERFIDLANYIHSFYGERRCSYSKHRKIVYSDSVAVDDFLNTLENHQHTVITHNGDRNITSDLVDRLPAGVKKWFAQNVCCDDPRIHSIPIGLENKRWFPETKKRDKILASRNLNKQPSRLVYMNHAVWTNPGVRQKPYDLFENQLWMTSVRGKNGDGFDEYLANIDDHFYTISPEGNGIDCHRTWEVLYCNRVPIMTKNSNTKFYEDLPILLVDRWEDITEEFLKDKREYFLTTEFNLQKLKFSYWRDLILSS